MLNRVARVTLTSFVGGIELESLIINGGGEDDLRIQIDVTNTTKSEPNECILTIENLSEASRVFVQTKPIEVRVDVGYEDVPMARLFTGDMTWSMSKRLKTGWETKIQAADGHRKWKDARVCTSLRAGKRARDALVALTTAMGVTIPPYLTEAQLDTEFLTGLTLQGPASTEMTKLMRRLGLEWSIQDGDLQILAPSQVRPGQALLVTQATGLIGVPEMAAPAHEDDEPVLDFRMLMEPRAKAGTLVKLKSRSISGEYRIERASSRGDTRGGEWETSVEAVAI